MMPASGKRRLVPRGLVVVHDDMASAQPRTVADVRQRRGAEREMALVAQRLPRVVGPTAALVAAAAARRSGLRARGSDRLVDGEDDVGDAGLIQPVSQQ